MSPIRIWRLWHEARRAQRAAAERIASAVAKDRSACEHIRRVAPPPPPKLTALPA